MSLERWIGQNQRAAEELYQETGKPTGGATGYCHRLFVATFSPDGTVPPDGKIGVIQDWIEQRHGIYRTVMTIPEDLDSWHIATAFAKECEGQPLAIVGHPPHGFFELHIAAFVWSADSGAWVAFDSRVRGGKLFTNDNGLHDWATEVFNIDTLQYYQIRC